MGFFFNLFIIIIIIIIIQNDSLMRLSVTCACSWGQVINDGSSWGKRVITLFLTGAYPITNFYTYT